MRTLDGIDAGMNDSRSDRSDRRLDQAFEWLNRLGDIILKQEESGCYGMAVSLRKKTRSSWMIRLGFRS